MGIRLETLGIGVTAVVLAIGFGLLHRGRSIPRAEWVVLVIGAVLIGVSI